MSRTQEPLMPKRLPVMPAQCATCIFRSPQDGGLELAQGRLDEIQQYLINGTSHYCHAGAIHGKKKPTHVCRGSRDFQLMIFARMGWISEPTDVALEAKLTEMGL